MRKTILTAVTFVLLASATHAKPFAEMFPQFTDFSEEELEWMAELDFQQGKVFLPGSIASLEVPEGFYYLGPEDANYVLTELWENPPSESMGMLFPADQTPIHSGGWGLNIEFDPIGYVSDEDADGYDYDEVLEAMHRDTKEGNKWRRENGYEEVKIIGWADPPKYDHGERTLHWAQELSFGVEDVRYLNYEIRVLGRKGVLIQNFIAEMSELDLVRASVPEVLAMTQFTQGNRYSDFLPGVDTVAAVGIGGLIAGKVLAKTGLFAVALIFLKKFWFLLLLIPIALKRFIVRTKP